MREDNLESLEYATVLKEAAERFEEYDQLSMREIQSVQLDFLREAATEMKLLRVVMQGLLDATFAQMNDHQLARFREMVSERQVKHNFDNLPTTKEN